MDKTTLIKVTNRNNGVVGYKIPEMNNLQRQFAPGASKEITFEELQNLYWLKGGRVLIENYLIIEDAEALKALQVQVEPEYFYTDAQIVDIMVNGTLDQFLDMLDFGNKGVKESIKVLAVDLPLNDVAKRKAILDVLGFNVDNAIKVKETKMDDGNTDNSGKKNQTGRRASVPNQNSEESNKKPMRRYKVVDK